MEYDPVRQEIVMYAGLTPNSNGYVTANDTWVWDGQNWTEITPKYAQPASGEPFQMVYDGAQNQVTLRAGGFYFWAGDGWKPQNPLTFPVSIQCGAYDSTHAEIVFYGDPQNRTWLWDGSAFTIATPPNSPTPRSNCAMAFDGVSGQVILFGGANQQGTLLGDTWAWSTGSACSPPTITVQPQSTSISNGQTETLSVTAAGTTPFSYQWYQGNSGDTSKPISNAIGGSLQISPASTTAYWVRVTNACGHTDSTPATISIVPTPTSTIASVVNAASGQPGVVPGSLVTIFGTNLANGTQKASGAPWPTTLGATNVLVNGIAAPLQYVSSSQINLQVPWEAAGGINAAIAVINNGTITTGAQVPTFAEQPGLFHDANGYAIASGTSYQLVTSQNPAVLGEYVTLYATGLGPVTTSVLSGSTSPSSPLAYTTTVAIVSVNGVEVPVLFLAG